MENTVFHSQKLALVKQLMGIKNQEVIRRLQNYLSELERNRTGSVSQGVMTHNEFNERIDAAEKAIEEGDFISQEEMEKRLKARLSF